MPSKSAVSLAYPRRQPCRNCNVPVRRVPPQFTILPDSEYLVMRGTDLEITCVAVGSPMPHVKWRKVSLIQEEHSEIKNYAPKRAQRMELQ